MSADNEAIPSTTSLRSATASNSKSPAIKAAKRRKWWRTNAPGAVSVAAEEGEDVATTIDAGDAGAKRRGPTRNAEANIADNSTTGKEKESAPTPAPKTEGEHQSRLGVEQQTTGGIRKQDVPQDSAGEYMLQMEAKVIQMEIDMGAAPEFERASTTGENARYSIEQDKSSPTAGLQPLPATTEATATQRVIETNRGVHSVPELEYGVMERPGSEDSFLAIASAVEDEMNPSVGYAVEYDPNSKPPFQQNRRFRLYSCATIILLAVACVGLGVGIGARRSPSPPATLSPTSSPSIAPSLGRELLYRKTLAAAFGNGVNVRGTAQYLAADWIIHTDPRGLSPSDPSFLQRYISVLFWIATTNNGQRPWRSCNPPLGGETAGCDFLRFERQNNDDVIYRPEPRTRWLTEVHECNWVGLICHDQVVHGIELCKPGMPLLVGYAIHLSHKLCQGGQNITGTLPTEIARLPFVQWISLAWNALTGTLPVEYAGMKHLLNLEVHGNNLVGTIPIEYWSANGLQQFNVGENLMSGTLSSEVGLLTNLRGFFLLDNMFTGTFPTEIGNLAFLGAFC